MNIKPTNYQKLYYRIIQVPGWFLLIYLIYAQGISALSYDLGVRMGTQEPAGTITRVGTAFWYGFAVGDILIYIPILFIGLLGHFFRKNWSLIPLSAALGITVYWPVVSLAALVDARGAPGWNIVNEMPYWIVCISISLWGLFGLLILILQRERTATDT